jgi:hypothetical protein
MSKYPEKNGTSFIFFSVSDQNQKDSEQNQVAVFQ